MKIASIIRGFSFLLIIWLVLFQQLATAFTTPQVPTGGIVYDGMILNVTTNPADVWRKGSSITIQWQWPQFPNSPVDVDLWRGAQKVANIAYNLPASAARWTVPYSLADGEYAVRVQSHRNASNYALKKIRVEQTALSPSGSQTATSYQYQTPPRPSIPKPVQSDGQISNITLMPQGVLRTGVTARIQWEWTGRANRPAMITAWKDGQKVADIATATPMSFASWTVPYTFPPGNYSIKVQSTNNPSNQALKSVQIDNSTITVTSPKSSDVLIANTQVPFTWTYQGYPGPVSVRINNMLIADNIPCGANGHGQSIINVPHLPEDSYIFTVASKASQKISSATPPIKLAHYKFAIQQPRSGEVFRKGQNITVLFTLQKPASAIGTMGTVGNAELFLERYLTAGQAFAGAPTYATLLNTVAIQPGNNSVMVTLPKTLSGTCVIRIRMKENSNIYSWSPAFKIQ